MWHLAYAFFALVGVLTALALILLCFRVPKSFELPMPKMNHHEEAQLLKILADLTREMHELGEHVGRNNQRIGELMSQISDFAAKQTAHNQKVSDDLDAISTEIQKLNDALTAIQNSPGTLSPADQASLDAAQVSAQALEDKANGMAAVSPPVVPAV